MATRPAVIRYTTACARRECSTRNASKPIPLTAILRRGSTVSRLDLEVPDRAPGLRGRVDRTGRGVAKASLVIGMRVCEDDRAGTDLLEPAAPVQAPVHYHIGAAIGDEQRAVPRMPVCARLDLPPRSEEPELHKTLGQTRSCKSEIPSSLAQCAQQKICPSASTPCPTTRQPQ